MANRQRHRHTLLSFQHKEDKEDEDDKEDKEANTHEHTVVEAFYDRL